MHLINPATEEILADVQTDDADLLQKKYRLLQMGQASWANESLQHRIAVIDKFKALLEQEKESLAKVLTIEVGKPLQQSRNEINGACTRITWLLNHAEKYLSDETMTLSDNLSEIISYEPLGVICNISAWNYPYLVGVNVIVPALLAGNSVLYKPSEYAVLTGSAIERLLKAAGLPDAVFQMAIGGKETGELLLDLPFDGYFFTGSYQTGQHIYERVAPKLVPCQLELGGKDPLYIADDVADINAVAIATADGAFYNNGQSCCAVERIYVHQNVADSYIDAFVQEVKSWKMGQPTHEGVYLGALTRKDQIAVLENQVRDALDKGATLLCGGKAVAGKGYFFEPTVLSHVNHSMLLMQQESFGPIIGIMTVKDDQEALKLMQDTEYGLTAAVYSSNEKRAKSILQKINAGTGYWNCCDRVSAALPWSGRKHSGLGATLSHQGIRAFAKPKAWHLKTAN
jgi:acyl-CoA reductase-like NAD-dependent aldehyde dehydrogenase